jgi:hypothetical protein
MITDLKNKTPFLLGLAFLALATTHEVEHIAEAFEIEDEAFEVTCDYCEENQTQDLVNSKTNITFIDFDIEDSKLVSLTDQSLSKNYHQRAPPKI